MAQSIDPPKNWSLDKSLARELAQLAQEATALQDILAPVLSEAKDVKLITHAQSLDRFTQCLGAIADLLEVRSQNQTGQSTDLDWSTLETLKLQSLVLRLQQSQTKEQPATTEGTIDLF